MITGLESQVLATTLVVTAVSTVAIIALGRVRRVNAGRRRPFISTVALLGILVVSLAVNIPVVAANLMIGGIIAGNVIILLPLIPARWRVERPAAPTRPVHIKPTDVRPSTSWRLPKPPSPSPLAPPPPISIVTTRRRGA